MTDRPSMRLTLPEDDGLRTLHGIREAVDDWDDLFTELGTVIGVNDAVHVRAVRSGSLILDLIPGAGLLAALVGIWRYCVLETFKIVQDDRREWKKLALQRETALATQESQQSAKTAMHRVAISLRLSPDPDVEEVLLRAHIAIRGLLARGGGIEFAGTPGLIERLRMLEAMTEKYPVEVVFLGYHLVFESRQDIRELVNRLVSLLGEPLP
jgi:hypothetical protein